jgi:hypothetical protein
MQKKNSEPDLLIRNIVLQWLSATQDYQVHDSYIHLKLKILSNSD